MRNTNCSTIDWFLWKFGCYASFSKEFSLIWFSYKLITKLFHKKTMFDDLQNSDTGITQFSMEKSIFVFLLQHLQSYPEYTELFLKRWYWNRSFLSNVRFSGILEFLGLEVKVEGKKNCFWYRLRLVFYVVSPRMRFEPSIAPASLNPIEL